MEAPTQKERPRWFHEARFGIFIHWGLYSLLGRGEWVMLVERIPREEYEKLAERFNPQNFDAESWVNLAKQAGARYMVLTTRHHDGFCLFNSRVSDFTSMKRGAKRDFVKEYVEAASLAGMKIGFYYSLLDWRFPGYHNREKYPESFEALVDQAHSQIRELMTQYGRIDYLFYDGEWIPGVKFNRTLIKQEESSEIAKLWRARELNTMVRKLQPHIIINNRSGLLEDVDTPEQWVVPSSRGRAWESCMTIGDPCGWGWIKHNPNMKPVTQLIQYLVQAASGEGNYLLNIGPRPDGTVRSEEVERLLEIGRWLRVHGESIYGSERVPKGFGSNMLGLWTAKGNISYLHCFRWPGKTLPLSGVKNKVLSAQILTTQEEVKVDQKADGRLFLKNLPQYPPDPYATVIKLELEGKPEAYNYEGIPL